MNTSTSKTLHATASHSLPAPSLENLSDFMTLIESFRHTIPRDQWRAFTSRDATLRSWRFLLSADPYTRWGLLKPRGYAGDATLMDFAYGHQSIQPIIESAGTSGKQIYATTAAAPQSLSARQRIQALSERLMRGALSEPEFSALSIASGHARELEEIHYNAKSRITRFAAIDTDVASLDEAARSAAGVNTQLIRRNVITSALDDVAPARLVYSLGLFDYLDDTHAESLLRKLLRLVLPGGELLVANLAEDAANIGYCEAVMDWWMIPRTQAEMLRLGNAVTSSDSQLWEVGLSRIGCFTLLRIGCRR